MPAHKKTACIFGGTGFIGRQIVRELARLGCIVKVATRVPESAYFLKTSGSVGQIVPFHCNYSDPESIRKAAEGCDYVVNTIGLLYEKGRNRKFQKAHVDVARNIAQACASEKVKRFVHISALGVDKAKSKYARTKLEGEKEVLKAFPDATILRPSVVFGAEDNFFNMFAQMMNILPPLAPLPLIGGGNTKFQPVFVGDVADAVIKSLTISDIAPGNPKGAIYELGGPEVVTFKEIFGILFEHTKRKRPLLPTPWPVAKMQGAFLSLLPSPLLTMDQVESLKTDNIVSEDAQNFKDLDIDPKAMASILPTYLGRFQPGGRFGDKKSA